ncbi:MAG: allophycocyanin [Chroococcus sp. CMT-3BRIN-NPC107]|jgi:AraC-like DNA-binding protein|nr:allophycocyanin [Chroococcus sp. CMT-3BRIN-NPC107]
MLKQLARLSNETEGRYASSAELQFIKDYIDSVDTRISAYNKIQLAATEIVDKVAEIRSQAEPELFAKVSQVEGVAACRRDFTNILRHSAAALLFDDRDRMPENFLLWYKTIVRTFNYDRAAGVTYKLIQDVAQEYLTPEESALFNPILQLNQVVLG